MTIQTMLAGFSIGYAYARYRVMEGEYRQGLNNLFTANAQYAQLDYVLSVMQDIAAQWNASTIPRPISLALRIAPYSNFFLIYTMWGIRGNFYSMFCSYARSWTEWMWVRINFPYLHSCMVYGVACLPKERSVSPWTIRVVHVCTDHIGDVGEVAMIVGTVALMVMGHRLYSSMLLTAFVYQKLASRGYIPRAVHLFGEKYISFFVDLINLIHHKGSWMTRLQSAFSLAGYFGLFKNITYASMDHCLRKYGGFFKNTASLNDIDTPLRQYKELSFEQIQGILTAYWPPAMDYVHCSKVASSQVALPKSREFDRLQQLFDTIDWDEKYQLVKMKCQDDYRFVAAVIEAMKNEATKETVVASIDHHITLAAKLSHQTEQQFVVGWFKAQMPLLVAILMGRRACQGSPIDLDEAIRNCEQILPYLLSRNMANPSERIEVEDILLGLTVEGGDYCARGIKRVSREILARVIQQLHPQEENQDPNKIFEAQVYQILEEKRKEALLVQYALLIATLGIPKEGGQDVHVFDLWRLQLSLGFLPLSPEERLQIDWDRMFSYCCFQGAFIPDMHREYRATYDASVKIQIGSLHIFNYIRQMIGQNPRLSEEQRSAILEMYTERNDGEWNAAATDERFRRLMFVMLGVLKPGA
jgi:hypothetical protein